jgi:hypothetical protein
MTLSHTPRWDYDPLGMTLVKVYNTLDKNPVRFIK